MLSGIVAENVKRSIGKEITKMTANLFQQRLLLAGLILLTRLEIGLNCRK